MKFDPEKFISEKIGELRNIDGKAITAVSGGVDSTVTAVLTYKTIGDRLKAIYIDDGLMRENEVEQTVRLFKRWNIPIRVVDAKKTFFDFLSGITDPEGKRKAFRDAFYVTLRNIIEEEDASCMVQGTIAADVIETTKGIKTQHNVLEQIGVDYGIQVIEPLRDLYKPEVRKVAEQLDLPEHVVRRKPFPGPGLATRILGEVTPERVRIGREATKIVEEETEDVDAFQTMAALLNDKATGIRENKRAYGEMVVVRAVSSEDAMTANVIEIPWEILRRINERITKEIPEVTHVLYSLTDKPPATIEFQ